LVQSREKKFKTKDFQQESCTVTGKYWEDNTRFEKAQNEHQANRTNLYIITLSVFV